MARIQKYKLNLHSNFPVLEFQVLNADREPVKLFGAAVHFWFRRKGSSAYLNAAATTCAITDAEYGKCEFQFSKTHLNARGVHFGVIEVHFPNGGVSKSRADIVFEVN